ncbi:MAG: universal stress protein [Burkholderiales bacterium]
MRTVLIPFDGSAPALRAVRSFIDLARAATRMHAIVLNVEPSVPFMDRLVNGSPSEQRRVEEPLRDKGETLLAPVKSELERAAIPYTAHVEFGDPADVIAARAKEWHADLIIMGASGRDAIGRFRPDAVAQKVLHQTDVPLMLVK